MTITRSKNSFPFPLYSLQREVDRMFNHVTQRASTEGEHDSVVWTPMLDVTENGDAYQLALDLPGVNKEDVKINFSENTLTVSGERKGLEIPAQTKFHRAERTSGKFYRSLSFSGEVNAAAISAAFSNGVLTVTVPKADKAKPKTIEIQ